MLHTVHFDDGSAVGYNLICEGGRGFIHDVPLHHIYIYITRHLSTLAKNLDQKR